MLANQTTEEQNATNTADTRVGTVIDRSEWTPEVYARMERIGKRLAARERGEPTGLVYFVQGRPGTPVKVGYTGYSDVSGRIAQLQTGNPYTLQAIFTLPGNWPQFTEIARSDTDSRVARFYRLDNLWAWLVANDIPHRLNKPYLHRLTIDAGEEASPTPESQP